jgi:MFS family permease
MLFVLATGWAILQSGRFLLSPLLPRISETLGFSPGEVGLALTAFGLVYAVVQYPSGTYSDVLSRATLLVPGFAVLVAAFATLGAAVTGWLFVAGVLLLGVGKGLYASPSRALLGDLFHARQGRALGIYSAGTDVGGLAAAGLAVAALATATWRVAFVPVVVGMVAVAALFVVWNDEPYRLRRVPLHPGRTIGRITASRAQRERLVAFSLFYFFVGGLTNFFPTLLVNQGFSEPVAGGVFALLFAVGLLTKPLAGEASDRWPRLYVAVAGLVVAAAGIGLVLSSPALPAVAVGTVLTAVGYKTQFPIVDALVMEAAPESNVGGDLGAARAVFLGANAVGPGAVGLIAGAAGFAVAFAALTAGLLLGAALLARQARR